MREMVWRVSQAIYNCMLMPGSPPLEARGETMMCVYETVAHVAIDAMREPTPEMIEGVAKVLYDYYGDQEDVFYVAEWETGVRAIFQAIADSALKEPKDETS